MDAKTLLAIIEPHRDMLKELGCEIIECVEHPWVLYNGTQQQPDHSALIIEAVARRDAKGKK